MARFIDSQNNFKTGEIGPQSLGDVSKEQYYNGCSKVSNFIPRKTGGVFRRPGTQYVTTLNNTTNDSYGIYDFIIDRDQAYAVIIKFNDGVSSGYNTTAADSPEYHFDIIRNDGHVCEVQKSTSFTSGIGRPGENVVNPDYQDICPLSGLQTATQIEQMFFTHSSGNMRPFFISRIAREDQAGQDTFAIFPVGGVGNYTAPSGVGLVENRQPTPVCASKAFTRLPNYPAQAITTPYTAPNVDEEIVLKVENLTGNFVKLTMVDNTATPDIYQNFWLSDSNTFQDNLLGSHIKFTIGASTYIARITAYETYAPCSPTANQWVESVQAAIVADDDGSSALSTVISNAGGEVLTDNWQLQEWSNRRGYPRSVTIHEQRLVYGGSVLRPDALWFSQLGNFYRFMSGHLLQDSTNDVSGLRYVGDGVQADDPFDGAPSSTETSPVKWLQSGDSLEVGTGTAEYIVRGVDDQALSALSVEFKVQTFEGSSAIKPAQHGRFSMFVNSSGTGVREFAVSAQTRRYEAEDANEHNNTIYQHLLGVTDNSKYQDLSNFKFEKMAYSRRFNTVFLKTNADALVSVTLTGDNRKAWARHTFGGKGNATTDPVYIKDICVLPSISGTNDELWAVCERYVTNNPNNGGSRPTTLTTVEKIGNFFDSHSLTGITNQDNAPIYFDLAKFITGSATNTFTYLEEMQDETVSVLADGVWHRDVVVATDGTITLDYDATEVVIGINREDELKPVPIVTGVRRGDATGAFKRVTEVTLKLYKSLLGKCGTDKGSLHPIRYRNYTMAPNEANLFTGNKKEKLDGSYEIDTSIKITVNGPYPFNILNITYDGISYE
jgi:hypothetical protein